MKKIILSIDGMTCSACSTGLEKYLNKQEYIKEATVNLVMNNASIEYDEKKLKLEDLEKMILKAGFKSLGIYNYKSEENKSKKNIYKLTIISVLALLELYISMAHMMGLPVITFLNMSKHPLNYAISLCTLTFIIIILGVDILKNGIKNLINKTPNMDTLVAIGVFSSFFYSIFGTIMIIKGNYEYVENLYYESASTIIFFIKIGKFIESRNKDKTKEAIKDLMEITPQNARVEKDGNEIIVTLDEIKKGDIIICKPGEKVAVDGIVTQGYSHINESFITGESKPVKKEKGSKVIAGCINYEGTIKYKAEKIGKDSTISEIVKMVVEATNTKVPIARIADKISSYFVPFIMLLAFASFVVWIVISKDFSKAINIFVSVLVIACPCSLGLATPLAIVIASGLCSKKGILVRKNEALENAHKVKTVVFDKTGTLTKGELTISKIFNYSNINEKEILRQIASIENKSEHPIARAIVNKAKDEKLELEHISEFEAIPGLGVKAKIGSDEFFIGNKKLMNEHFINILNEDDEDYLTNEGNSVLFVSKNGRLIALIGVKDILRENVKDVINSLKQKNIHIVMLSGDNENTANSIAKEIGIDSVIANVKPKEKAEVITKLKHNGKVMMCGDGINDSISLVTADIGVSISNGTDIAIDSSDIVLMNEDLNKIIDIIYISKKTIRNIKQNLFWAFFYNTCMIPIAMGLFGSFGIKINPMFAAFAMTLSSLTVVFNALRLKRIS